MLVDVGGTAHLLHLAAVEDSYSVAHGERFFLVMRDEDKRNSHLLLDVLQLPLHFLSQLEIQCAQGFIQKKHTRLIDQGPRQRDSLALAPGKLGWLAVPKSSQLDKVQHLIHSLRPHLPGNPLDHQPVCDVLINRHVGKEGVVLKYRIHRSLIRRKIGNVTAHRGKSGRYSGTVESGDHAKTRSLARARRTQHRKELAVTDFEVQARRLP